MKVAKFKLEKKDGLEQGHIYVDDVYLPAVNGECAEYFEDTATDFLILWRISGPTGSSFVVTMEADGKKKEIVNSQITAKDKGQRSSFIVVRFD